MSVTVLRRAIDGYTYAGQTDLRVLTCPTCGIVYALPEALYANALERGERKIFWYCPNGHRLGFDETELDRERQKAQRERDRAARLQARLDQTEATLRTQKGRATRFKNDRDRERTRVAGGVCPCCNRTFQNLGRHMAGQHPDFPPPDKD